MADTLKNQFNTLWVDVETTGIIGEDDHTCLIELAAFICDPHLNIIADFGSKTVAPTHPIDERVSPEIVQMHNNSGLWEDLQHPDYDDITGLDEDFAAWIRNYFPAIGDVVADGRSSNKFRGAVLAGSSVQFDREVIRSFMPETFSLLHYRNLDVSSVTLFMKNASPFLYNTLPQVTPGNHRAAADLRTSLETLKLMKKIVR